MIEFAQIVSGILGWRMQTVQTPVIMSATAMIKCRRHVDYIFCPQGRTVGSAPGYFRSQVMVVVRVRVSVSVNRVKVWMADGKWCLSCIFIYAVDGK